MGARLLFLIALLLLGPSLAQAAQPAPAGEVNLLDATAAKVFGDEAKDFGIKPKDRLQDGAHIDGPTPTTIPGGNVITTGELARAIENQSAYVFDVLQEPGPHRPLPNSFVWSYANAPGSFKDAIEATVKQVLDGALGGDKSAPLVFYCLGSSCWEGYNAALRAIHAGYRNVYWYRGGLQAWQTYQQSLTTAKP